MKMVMLMSKLHDAEDPAAADLLRFAPSSFLARNTYTSCHLP